MPETTSSGRPSVLSDPGDVRHLLRRFAWTSTPAAESRLTGKPLDEAVETLIADSARASEPKAPDYALAVWTNSSLRYPETTSKEYQRLRAIQSEESQARLEQLRQWWLQEMVSSQAPLREWMTLFLHGTLGNSTGSADMPQAQYGTLAILRREALGSIPAMLESLITDPGMMLQIGMDEHRVETGKELTDRPGRLVLERWTVGKGAFTDADAKNLSRALTGWVTVAPPGAAPARQVDPEAFRSARRTGLVPTFEAAHFVAGDKTILGVTRTFDAKSAIQFLARHPATAKRYSRELIEYFGVDDPQGQLEARLVQAYQSSEGSMRVLLRTIAASDQFWSQASRWSLVKSPVHLAVAACRQLGLTSPPLAAVSDWLNASGQRLLNTPNFGDGGWPGQEAWLTPPDRLAVRYQLPLVLNGEAPRLGLTGEAGKSRGAGKSASWTAVNGLSASAILQRLDPAPGLDAAKVNGAALVRVVMAAPEYQLV